MVFVGCGTNENPKPVSVTTYSVLDSVLFKKFFDDRNAEFGNEISKIFKEF